MAETHEDERLCEMYLVVRPEERQAVERAIECVLPCVHSTFNAVGRGLGGGLRYSGAASKWPFGRRAPRAEFLPNTVFYLVAPRTTIDEVLDSVRDALRAEGGDAERGLGAAFVLPLEGEIAIRGSRRTELEEAAE